MSLFIPQRRLLRPTELLGKLTFPNVFNHEIELNPRDLFGVPGDEKRMVFPASAEVRVLWNANSGERTHEAQLIDAISISDSSLNIQYSFQGNVLRVAIPASTLTVFQQSTAALATRVELFLSLTTGVSVKIIKHHIKTDQGLLRNEMADCSVRSKVTTKELCESEIKSGMKKVFFHKKDNQRLTSALFYYRQGLALYSTGDGSMKSEVLINLYKAIEIVFGNTAEQVRKKAKDMKVYNKKFEALLVSLIYVRNSIDVAHSSLSVLSPEEYQLVDQYVIGVVHELGAVLTAISDTCENHVGVLFHDVQGKDPGRTKILWKIKENLDLLAKGDASWS